MPRHRRHMHARHDEWIVIHRDPSRNGGCGGLIPLIFLALMLGGC
jgi:hypothetical protein